MSEELHPAVEEQIRENEGSDMISKANAAAARLEAANKRQEELLRQQESLRVKESFGGRAAVNNEPKELSDKEYAEKALRGEVDE